MDIITNSYKQYYPHIRQYISNRIVHKYVAEDLAQDVFVRLMDCKQMLNPETVKYFIFTIARNIILDYVRRHYKKEEVYEFYFQNKLYHTNETEEIIWVNDLQRVEKQHLRLLTPQRRIVYEMFRFEAMNIAEISGKLHLERRTVENHLRMGRKIMRNYLKQSI